MILMPKETPDPIVLVEDNLRNAKISADVEQVFPDLEDVFVAVTAANREGLDL